MRLWLDPAKLAQRGLTATNVLSALQEQNVQVGGRTNRAATVAGRQSYQISVRAVGRLSEASEFDKIILKTGTDGTLVRLKDVGRAELGRKITAPFFGTTAMTPWAGGHAASARMRWTWTRPQRMNCYGCPRIFPPGIKAAVAFDTTTVIGESIRDVLITLLQAILLVIIVIYVFLQD